MAIGQIIGVVIDVRQNYCKILSLDGFVKEDGEIKDVYKTKTAGTTNLNLLNKETQFNGLELTVGDRIKCEIEETYLTGTAYSINNCGVGYRVNVLEIEKSSLELDL